MKKFVLITSIVGGTAFVLGLILAIIGFSKGGIELFTKGRELVSGYVEPYMISVEYNSDYPIVNGNVNDMQVCSSGELEGVVLNLAVGEMSIEDSDTDYVGIVREGIGEFQYYIEEGILYVNATKDVGEVHIYLPKDLYLTTYNLTSGAGEVNIENKIYATTANLIFGAGDIQIEHLEVEELSLEAGACNLEIADAAVGNLDFSLAAGNVEYTGNIYGNATVDSSMGNVVFSFDEGTEEFNYNVKCHMGNMDIPGFSVVGFSTEKEIDNGASHQMDIDSNMGNLVVQWLEE